MEKLRVWNMINFREKLDYYDVKTTVEALKLIHSLSEAQLKNRDITDNAFGLEIYNEEEKNWEEWMDDDGFSIDEYEIKDGQVIVPKW
jgi:hypothetical protein